MPFATRARFWDLRPVAPANQGSLPQVTFGEARPGHVPGPCPALLPTPAALGRSAPPPREATARPHATLGRGRFIVLSVRRVSPAGWGRARPSRLRLFPGTAERQEQSVFVEFVFPHTSRNQCFKLRKNSFGIWIEISLVPQVGWERANASGQNLVFGPGTRWLRVSAAAEPSPMTCRGFPHGVLARYASRFDALYITSPCETLFFQRRCSHVEMKLKRARGS